MILIKIFNTYNNHAKFNKIYKNYKKEIYVKIKIPYSKIMKLRKMK